MNFLKKKAIRLYELLDSFEATNNEEGMCLLNKPETDINIIRPPIRITTVNCRDPIKIVCEVNGFPKPTIAYYKRGVSKALQHTNEFKLDSAS